MVKKCEDILIVGGGLIGLCLAPILANLNFKITLIDKGNITSKESIYKDKRTVAISYGTKLFFEKKNIWREISKYAEPIKTIKVINRKKYSNILFDNKKKNKPMGYIVKNSILKRILINKIKLKNNIKILENKKINQIEIKQNSILVSLKKNKNILTKVLIAADGKNSYIKSLCKIPQYEINYNQSALALNFWHSKNHNNTAYEIFLPNGPLATLPVHSNKKNYYMSSLIWSEKNSTINSLFNLEKNLLSDLIEEKIFTYLGKIKIVDNPKIFPLSAHICRRFYDKRIAFVGDSAHSLHPIAGQGWNLGIRDIKYLIQAFENNINLGQDIGSLNVLKEYNDMRITDVANMLFATHGLNKIFSSNSKIVGAIRSFGFKHINKNKKLTNSLVDYAMGVNL